MNGPLLVAGAWTPPFFFVCGSQLYTNAMMLLNPIHIQVHFVLIHRQVAMVEWAWEWTRLLPAYQDMCQITFKTLLANR